MRQALAANRYGICDVNDLLWEYRQALVPAVYQGASYAGHLPAAVDRVAAIVRFHDCSLPHLLGMREAVAKGQAKERRCNGNSKNGRYGESPL
jgi:hypothetical protein